jgi:hypothetical protein
MSKKKQTPEPASQLIPARAQIGPDESTLKKIMAGYQTIAKVVVNDSESSLFAQELVTGWKKEQKRLLDERMDITRDLDNAKKKIIALYAPSQAMLDQMIEHLSGRVIAYDKKIRDEAAEAQRKIDEEVERKRQADLKLAEKARARGDADKAEEFELRAETRVAPVVQTTSAVAPGRSMPEVFSFEVVDESKFKREYLQPDSAKVGKVVRALGKDAEETVGKGAIKVTSSRSLRG